MKHDLSVLTPEEKRDLLKALTKRENKSPSFYPLSYGQRALWHIQNLMPETSVYNVSLAWVILSKLEIQALHRTFQWLLDRHSALRTTYHLKDRLPVQQVHQAQKVHFRIHQSSDWGENELNKQIGAESRKPFNLENGPLMRVHLFVRSEGSHILLVSFHHIAVDLWSSTFIFDEIARLYPVALSGEPPPLPASTGMYIDYVAWQRELLSGPRGEILWNFWKNLLEEDLAPVKLPFQLRKSEYQSFIGTAHPFKLNRDLTRGLRSLAKKQHITLYNLLLTGFQVLLHRYSGQDRFFIRSLTVGRSRAEWESVIGFFANPVILKADFSEEPSFLSVLKKNEKAIFGMIEHQDFPFELLMEKICFGKNLKNNPNPEIMFILQTPQRFITVRQEQYEIPHGGIFSEGRTGIKLNLGGLLIEKTNPEQTVTLNDLALEMAEVGEELSGLIQYRTDLFLPEAIADMGRNYRELLEFMIRNPDRPVSGFTARNGFPVNHGAERNDVPVDLTPEKKIVQRSNRLPISDIEKKLSGIWGEVLCREHIQVSDDFFRIGGNSLQALQMITLVRDTFAVDLPLRKLFELRTLASLADLINESTTTQNSSEIKAIERNSSDYPLSFAQERLWYLDRLSGGNPFYNIPVAVRLRGALDQDTLAKSVNIVVQRHEILRTAFRSEEGEPRQVIFSNREIAITVADASGKGLAEAASLASAEAGKPFDLSRGPLLRVLLIRLAPDDHVAVLTMHHIVSDGRSIEVFFGELVSVYSALKQNLPIPSLKPALQYVDYAVWQKRWFEQRASDGNEQYWKEKLNNLPHLTLPYDRPRSSVRSFSGGSINFSFTKKIVNALRKIAVDRETTLFMVLAAAFAILLRRYSGQNDFSIGIPIAGRNRAEIDDLLGCFINILPLRMNIGDDLDFLGNLKRVKEISIDALSHQDLPYDRLVQLLQPERINNRDSLFQVMFAYQRIRLPSLHIPGLSSLERFDFERGVSQNDLTLFIDEENDALNGLLEYNSQLFNKGTAQRMIDSFSVLIKGIVDDPARKISEYPIISQKELFLTTVKWNRTDRLYPPDVLAHELFETQARETPSAVAVFHDGEQLTYRELDDYANQLANHLVSMGVEPGTLVGILMRRSIDLVACILGVLKTGAAFVPLDPDWPQSRLDFVISEIDFPLLLTNPSSQRQAADFRGNSARFLDLDEMKSSITAKRKTKPDYLRNSASLAYLIYTSGSTGRPKGTMISHKALTNYLYWCRDEYNPEKGSGIPLHSSIAVDFSMTCLFLPLISGNTLVLMDESRGSAPLNLARLTGTPWGLLKLTPLHAQVIGEQLSEKSNVRVYTLLLGGEELKGEHVALWRRKVRDVTIINEYGPTEATVGCAVYRIPEGTGSVGVIPIGKPIANMRLYILDQYGNPVPIGVSGELWIAGTGLAKGYFKRPELTEERFLPDPFSSSPGAKRFKTGDLARYLPSGEIEYLGRVDRQVKLRGHRIELEEIETVLWKHPAVKAVAVKVLEKGMEKSLAAYIVPTDKSGDFNAEIFRSYLRHQVPGHMIPNYFTFIDSFPMTMGGKIDYEALPFPNGEGIRSRPSRRQIPPATDIQKKMVRIWCDVLGIDSVGISDNFFELGGHSLQTLRLQERIQKEFNVQLSLEEFLSDPCIDAQSGLVESASREHEKRQRLPGAEASLVELVKGGELPPLFCIHATGGSATVYSRLCRERFLDRPVLGIQSKGLFHANEENDTIYSMAEEYVHIIRSRQPEGPYHLMGWSMGGIIALTCAAVMEEQNEEIAFLGMLEPYQTVPEPVQQHESFWRHLIHDCLGMQADPASLELLQTAENPLVREEIVERMMKNSDMAPRSLGGKQLSDLAASRMKLIERHNELLLSFQPPKVRAAIHLWHTGRGTGKGASDPKIGDYQNMTYGKLHLHHADGDHFSMLHPPHAHRLADTIARVLTDPGRRRKRKT